MKDFVKRMIIEHKELVERTSKLEQFLLVAGIEKMDKAEFAAANVQLSAMRTYGESLGARLLYHDVVILGDKYVVEADITPEEDQNPTNNEK